MATLLQSVPIAPTPSIATPDRSAPPETWAASRGRIQQDEKELMAHYFAHHDFLLHEGANPVADTRETAATFLVNQGTSPNRVVRESLAWIAEHRQEGPFHVTWYSPSALVPTTLYDFRMEHPQLSAATHVHLFPGMVDIQLQAQVDEDAVRYADGLTRQFSYLILSGHSFDLRTGEVRFLFDRELPIQRSLALQRATEKFLFFDSTKFRGEGVVGYSVRDLLKTCKAVVIYTVWSKGTAASPGTTEIKAAFDQLSAHLLAPAPEGAEPTETHSLRLTIVGRENVASESLCYSGYLRGEASSRA